MKKLTLATLLVLCAVAVAGCISRIADAPIDTSAEDVVALASEPMDIANMSVAELYANIMDLGVHVTLHQSGDLYMHSTIESLSYRTSDIIRGVVLSQRVDLLHSGFLLNDAGEFTQALYDIATINQITIVEVFEGDWIPGDIIEVLQWGGSYGYITLISNSSAELAINEQFVLFLRRLTLTRGADAFITGDAIQGAFRFPPATEVAHANNLNVELEGVCPYNRLGLTLDNLTQIQEANRVRQEQ